MEIETYELVIPMADSKRESPSLFLFRERGYLSFAFLDEDDYEEPIEDEEGAARFAHTFHELYGFTKKPHANA